MWRRHELNNGDKRAPSESEAALTPMGEGVGWVGR